MTAIPLLESITFFENGLKFEFCEFVRKILTFRESTESLLESVNKREIDRNRLHVDTTSMTNVGMDTVSDQFSTFENLHSDWILISKIVFLRGDSAFTHGSIRIILHIPETVAVTLLDPPEAGFQISLVFSKS